MQEPTRRSPVALAVLLVLGGLGGLVAAFALTLERIAVLEDPGTRPGCDFSLVVQCGENLSSAQGSVLGFPNPLIGLMAFPAVIVVGTALLAGARFARWFAVLVVAGFAIGFGFVTWLIVQSIFVLGTLCPWCMAVWAVMIPMTLAVLLDAVRSGVVPASAPARRTAAALFGWIPFLTLLGYLLIAVVAQIRLDVLAYL